MQTAASFAIVQISRIATPPAPSSTRAGGFAIVQISRIATHHTAFSTALSSFAIVQISRIATLVAVDILTPSALP